MSNCCRCASLSQVACCEAAHPSRCCTDVLEIQVGTGSGFVQNPVTSPSSQPQGFRPGKLTSANIRTPQDLYRNCIDADGHSRFGIKETRWIASLPPNADQPRRPEPTRPGQRTQKLTDDDPCVHGFRLSTRHKRMHRRRPGGRSALACMRCLPGIASRAERNRRLWRKPRYACM